MKKQLIAAAVAGAFALPAMAQVTISGSIQSGVMDTGASGEKATVATRLGGGLNAININSSEDLGGGMSAGSSFQIRFDAAGQARASGVGPSSNTTGAAANFAGNASGHSSYLFHNANVFLSSNTLGTVRVGKIAEDSNCAFDPWACGGGAGMIAGHAGGISGLIFADSMDRSWRYESPRIGGFNLNYHSTLAQAAAGSTERSLINLTYTAGPFFAQYMQGELVNKSEQSGLGFSYNLGFMTAMVNTAVSKGANGVKTRDMTMLAATVPLRPGLTALLGYGKDNSAASGADSKMAVGVNYALSKRTTVGADVFQQERASGSAGYVLRARHTF